VISCLTCFVSAGILLGQYDLSQALERKNNWENYSQKNFQENSGQNIFVGKVREIKPSQVSQKITINLVQDPNYKLKIVTHNFPEYKVGDILEIKSKVKTRKTQKIIFPDPDLSQTSFNLENQNRLEEIDQEISFPEIEKIGETKSLLISFANFRNKLIEILNKNLDRQTAALDAGLLLGEKSLFSQEELKDLRASGLSHLVVLSGFNITILLVLFSLLFSFFSLPWRVFWAILLLVIFIFFVGASPSLVRAGIMGSILLLANVLGRQYLAKQALFYSAFWMMIISPRIAVYETSFHLSFLATFGILYLTPWLDEVKWLNSSKNFLKNIFQILKNTLAAETALFPYLMFTFGKISLLGVLANILVMPIIPLLMLLALLVIIFSSLTFLKLTFINFLPKIFLIILSHLNLILSKFVFSIASLVANFPLSQINNYISGYSLFLSYLLLAGWLFFAEQKKDLQQQREVVLSRSKFR